MNGSATLAPTVRRLDDDTAMVTVAANGPPDCEALAAALAEAERLGTPGLVIDLSPLPHAEAELVASVGAFQKRCLDSGRWLLVMPPVP